MKKIDLGQTFQILANVGVIVGIIFLAVELRQNNEQLRLQSYQAWVAANMELNMAIIEPSLSQIFDAGLSGSTNLSKETYISYAMWHTGLMQMAQTTDYLYRAGSLDHDLWESEINRAAGILTIPGVRQWWDAGGKTQFTSQFVEMIESVEPKLTIWSWEKDRGYVPLWGPADEQ